MFFDPHTLEFPLVSTAFPKLPATCTIGVPTLRLLWSGGLEDARSRSNPKVTNVPFYSFVIIFIVVFYACSSTFLFCCVV